MTGIEWDELHRLPPERGSFPASSAWKSIEDAAPELVAMCLARLVAKHPHGRAVQFNLPYHPKELRLCRVCSGPLPKDKRRATCSCACARVWDLLRWGDPEYVVRARDRDTCALCGMSETTMRAIEAELWDLRRPLHDAHPIGPAMTYAKRDAIVEQRLLELLVDRPDLARYVRIGSCRFEVDHVVPVVEGGGNELSNLRLLCRPCHVECTAALAWKRAQERRDRRIGSRLPFLAPEVRDDPPPDAAADGREAPDGLAGGAPSGVVRP